MADDGDGRRDGAAAAERPRHDGQHHVVGLEDIGDGGTSRADTHLIDDDESKLKRRPSNSYAPLNYNDAHKYPVWKLWRVMGVFFSVLFSMSLLIPVLPSLLLNIVGDSSRASYVGGLIVVLTTPAELVLNPMLGVLSDRIGRRPILMFSLLGFGLEMSLLAMFRSLPLYILAKFVSVLSTVFPTTIHACVADVVAGSGREAVYFGALGFAAGLSFAIGPLTGGLIVAYRGEQSALWLSVILTAFNTALIPIIVPETLEERHRVHERSGGAFGAGGDGAPRMGGIFNIGEFWQLFHRTPLLTALVTTQIFLNFTSSWHVISYLYFHEKLGWSAKEIGTLISVAGVLVMINQGVLTRFVLRIFGEVLTLKLGFFAELVNLVMLAMGTRPWHVYAALVIGSLGWVAVPTLKGIISRQVAKSEQGALQGGLAAVATMQSGVASLLMSAVFGFFTSKARRPELYLPSAPFVFVVFNMLLAIVALFRAERVYKSCSGGILPPGSASPAGPKPAASAAANGGERERGAAGDPIWAEDGLANGYGATAAAAVNGVEYGNVTMNTPSPLPAQEQP